ncbi:MAG: alpha-glucosidase/alpha-galactosidase [Clostridiales bacterium]|jgi:alpha-galactosidase|nr:alpha-glucosidase/alpha-galactosidase [Clostridiales bacterium]
MAKSFKVCFIGAGSIGFTRKLLSDILTVPEFRGIDVAFTDISEHNLDMVTRLCRRDIEAAGLPATLTASTDRREMLRGAKYVIICVRVGGLEAFATDIEIPLRYGVDQCVGDTLCAGGLMYAQRDIPVMLDFCKDIREVALPDCLVLNYANPNAMVTWTLNQYGGVNAIGLCHGVAGGHRQIADVLGADIRDVDIVCAGINHQTWYVSVKLRGEEVPQSRILEGFLNHPKYRETEKCRIDVMKRFGYYSTESNGHLSEYLPWYRKRHADIPKWIHMDNWIDGQTGGYLRVCTEGRNWFETDFPNWLREPPAAFTPEERSGEHGSYIIEGLETGRLYRGHFNVVNDGCITNLPDDAIVEVPGYVDYNGVNIPKVGALPHGCAAMLNASVSVQRLGVLAGVSGDDTLLRQAMLLDPLVGAVCSPDEVWRMVDDLLIAQKKWLPQYAAAIAEAERRPRAEAVPFPDYQGYRVAPKTVEEMSADKERARKLAAASEKAGL